MRTYRVRRAPLLEGATVLFLGWCFLLSRPVVAAGPPTAKRPEVSTAGSGPYSGPTTQEQAKRAQEESAAATIPSAKKAAEAVTIAPRRTIR